VNQQHAIEWIDQALKETLDTDNVQFHLETDLVQEKILDSLDSMVFLLCLSELSGKSFPEDQDLVEVGLFKVDRLVDYLLQPK